MAYDKAVRLPKAALVRLASGAAGANFNATSLPLLPVLARRRDRGLVLRARLICGVLLAGAADAADGRQALLEGGEAAIASAAGAAAAVDRAPRIVLRLGACAKRGNGNENSQREKQDSHDRLPSHCSARSRY